MVLQVASGARHPFRTLVDYEISAEPGGERPRALPASVDHPRHLVLLKHLIPYISGRNAVARPGAPLEAHLALPTEEREAGAGPLFEDLAL